MKKFNLIALLFGALLFLTLGATSVNAAEMVEKAKSSVSMEKGMKCGAGKCGGEQWIKDGKCGAGKCGSDMKKSMKKDTKKSMKCGAGKCGDDMKKTN
ncbi:hypothetical protein [Sulfurimonas sp.]|uniref:HvfA family oxazolone/thioamide-modified RiPP metallophore n=1 Tax=Sulfurimonas sp. TaxID=2022749 RepID=UPI0025F49ECB|nr:hypothetical protein [Sulfurimonas sp.]